MILTSNRRPVFADKIVHADDAVSIAYSIRPYEGETWTVSDGLTDYSFKTTEVSFGRALRIAAEIFSNPVPVRESTGALRDMARHIFGRSRCQPHNKLVCSECAR